MCEKFPNADDILCIYIIGCMHVRRDEHRHPEIKTRDNYLIWRFSSSMMMTGSSRAPSGTLKAAFFIVRTYKYVSRVHTWCTIHTYLYCTIIPARNDDWYSIICPPWTPLVPSVWRELSWCRADAELNLHGAHKYIPLSASRRGWRKQSNSSSHLPMINFRSQVPQEGLCCADEHVCTKYPLLHSAAKPPPQAVESRDKWVGGTSHTYTPTMRKTLTSAQRPKVRS